MALMDDKDAASIFSIISPYIKYLILTKPNTQRATEPELLKQIATNYISEQSIEILPDVSIALRRLIELNQTSVILGSFYLAEEIKKEINEKYGDLFTLFDPFEASLKTNIGNSDPPPKTWGESPGNCKKGLCGYGWFPSARF